MYISLKWTATIKIKWENNTTPKECVAQSQVYKLNYPTHFGWLFQEQLLSMFNNLLPICNNEVSSISVSYTENQLGWLDSSSYSS